MDQEELLMMLQARKAEEANRKEINLMVFMEMNKLSDKEVEYINLKYNLKIERPAVVNLPNGDRVKLNWEGIK